LRIEAGAQSSDDGFLQVLHLLPCHGFARNLLRNRRIFLLRGLGRQSGCIEIHDRVHGLFGCVCRPVLQTVVRTARSARPSYDPGYSVDTGFSSPANAAWNVCQASVAHFTRTGNSRTPVNTASFPRSACESLPVTRSWKPRKIDSACSSVL